MQPKTQRYETPEIRTLHGHEILDRFGPVAGGSFNQNNIFDDTLGTTKPPGRA